MKWIKTGWGKNYSPAMNKNSLFHINFSEIKISSRPIVDVATETIKRISEEYPEPYYLMASGGVDSQSMIWLWENSGVPYKVISFKYIHDDVIYNSHDLDQLDEFSVKNNIPVTYKYFDPINFFENELLSYATKFHCTSPQICTHMKLSENLSDGTVIFSGEFGGHNIYTYTIFGLKRYTDISKRCVVPFFYLHDAELAGVIKRCDAATTIDSGYLHKVASIHNAGIPVIPQIQKYTGFEKIKDFYDEQSYRVSIQDRIQYSEMPSKRVFDILFRYKLTDTIKYKDNMVYKW
jgi:hypothetical protein